MIHFRQTRIGFGPLLPRRRRSYSHMAICFAAGGSCGEPDRWDRENSRPAAGAARIVFCSIRSIKAHKGSYLFFHEEPRICQEPVFDGPVNSHSDSNSAVLFQTETQARNPSDRELQRANGTARISLHGSERGTRIVEVFQQSPIRVLFPKALGSAVEEAVLINTAGGIAGGDRLEISVTALGKASITVTSQAAERVYRALSEHAHISTKLNVGESAQLAWLPQETIVFNRARLKRETEIDLSSDAELLALEWLVLGRAAHGEELTGGHIADSWRVKKDGRLVWADTFRVSDEICAHLHRQALLAGCKAIATLIYFGPRLERMLEFLRDTAPSLDCHCAVSSVAGLIVVRFAAKQSSDLRVALRSVIQQFSRELGGGPFRVPKMWSC